jgi:DHA1 family tetracycline resistance protein-like MFS transporter
MFMGCKVQALIIFLLFTQPIPFGMTNPKPSSIRFAVFLIVLLDVMGLGLIIPSMPFLGTHFGADPKTVTLLGTTYAGFQFVLTPIWGALSDRFGRKPILFATLTVTALGHLAFASAGSLLGLFVARALAGTGAGNIATAQAVLADTHPSEERSRAMAIIGAAFGLGFIFGPLIGGVLFVHVHHSAPALFAGALAALNLFLVIKDVPETRHLAAVSKRPKVHLSDFFRLEPALRNLVFTTLLTITAFALMEQSIGLYIQRTWSHATGVQGMNEGTSLTTYFLVVVGISAIFVQGYLVRRWLKNNNEVRIFKLGLCTLAISLALIPFFGWLGNYPIFLTIGALLALGSGMFNPSIAGLVSQSCSEDRQGFGLAINQSSAALGRIIGPTAAGLLFQFTPSAPFMAGSALVLTALLFSARIRPARG